MAELFLMIFVSSISAHYSVFLKYWGDIQIKQRELFLSYSECGGLTNTRFWKKLNQSLCPNAVWTPDTKNILSSHGPQYLQKEIKCMECICLRNRNSNIFHFMATARFSSYEWGLKYSYRILLHLKRSTICKCQTGIKIIHL